MPGILIVMAERTCLPRFHRTLLFIAPLVLAGLAWGVPLALYSGRAASKPVAASTEPDGVVLFRQHCAYCHGPNGDGRGSAVLDPPSRAFGRDKFKFATTLNGVPDDADLMRVIRRGIPGSSMPSFEHLPDAECRAVVEHVRRLTRQGVFDRFAARALKNDDDVDYERFAQLAATECQPAAKLEIPAIPPGTPESVARGKVIYVKVCAPCHGTEGKGDGPQVKDLKNDDGTPNVPRDLTLGLYKGGGEPEQLYARIKLGIPGTPMPAADEKQTPEEIIALVHFLQSLPKPDPYTNREMQTQGKTP